MRIIKKFVKKILAKTIYFYWIFKCSYNRFRINGLIKSKPRVHLGCGDVKFKDYINIDARATGATDIIADCTNLSFINSRSVSTVLSVAFLEHVYLQERERCVSEISRILRKNGKAVILSIPDFEIIASSYLKKLQFRKHTPFDAFQAYRLTHGDPEQAHTWWLGQLHKSLFDTKTVKELFSKAGFTYYIIFRYCFGDELLPVNLGIIASKKSFEKSDKLKIIENIFVNHNLNFRPETIKIVASSL